MDRFFNEGRAFDNELWPSLPVELSHAQPANNGLRFTKTLVRRRLDEFKNPIS